MNLSLLDNNKRDRHSGCCGAVRGTTIQGIADQQIATGTIRTTRTTTTGFVYSELSSARIISSDRYECAQSGAQTCSCDRIDVLIRKINCACRWLVGVNRMSAGKLQLFDVNPVFSVARNERKNG